MWTPPHVQPRGAMGLLSGLEGQVDRAYNHLYRSRVEYNLFVQRWKCTVFVMAFLVPPWWMQWSSLLNSIDLCLRESVSPWSECSLVSHPGGRAHDCEERIYTSQKSTEITLDTVSSEPALLCSSVLTGTCGPETCRTGTWSCGACSLAWSTVGLTQRSGVMVVMKHSFYTSPLIKITCLLLKAF